MKMQATAWHDRREIKHAPLPLRGISTTGSFEGYASLFDTADLGRDVVTRGAFADSLRKRGPGGVKMLWQHDAAEPIGSWLSIAEDARGLKVRGQLNLAVARAREILALMRTGSVDGLSIGFRTKKAIADAKTGLRRLQAVDLWEISLVTFPMHPGARVTQVKRAVVDYQPIAHIPRRAPLDIIRGDLAKLRWRRDALAVEHVLRKSAPALERCFSVDQPRDDAGRWTGGGGAEADRVSDDVELTAPPYSSPLAQSAAYCKLVKELCIAEATDALPTRDFGASFWKTMNACLERHGCLGKV